MYRCFFQARVQVLRRQTLGPLLPKCLLQPLIQLSCWSLRHLGALRSPVPSLPPRKNTQARAHAQADCRNQPAAKSHYNSSEKSKKKWIPTTLKRQRQRSSRVCSNSKTMWPQIHTMIHTVQAGTVEPQWLYCNMSETFRPHKCRRASNFEEFTVASSLHQQFNTNVLQQTSRTVMSGGGGGVKPLKTFLSHGSN